MEYVRVSESQLKYRKEYPTYPPKILVFDFPIPFLFFRAKQYLVEVREQPNRPIDCTNYLLQISLESL